MGFITFVVGRRAGQSSKSVGHSCVRGLQVQLSGRDLSLGLIGKVLSVGLRVGDLWHGASRQLAVPHLDGKSCGPKGARVSRANKTRRRRNGGGREGGRKERKRHHQ